MRHVINPALYSVISLFVLLSIIAVAPASNRQIVSADEPTKLFFQDDFSNSNSGWGSGKLNIGSYKYDTGSFSINLDTPQYHLYTNNKNIPPSKDLIVEVDVTMVAADKEDWAELIAGWVITNPQAISPEEDRPDNYYFHISPASGLVRIYTWEQSVQGRASKAAGYFLRATPVVALKQEKQTNNLRYVFKGNQFKAFLNNILLVDAIDLNLAFGYRLMDLGLVDGKFIYIGVSKSSYFGQTSFKFDNFKLYGGTQKAFLVPEELKDTAILTQRIKAAEDYGFDIGLIEYYGKSTDFTQTTSKLIKSQPVAIQIICQSSDKLKIEEGMRGYTGETVYDEINLTDFVISEINIENSPIKKGDELKISITAKNTGYRNIKQLSCNYEAIDLKGSTIFSGKSESIDLPMGKNGNLGVIQNISPLYIDGDYKLKVTLSALDTNTSKAIKRENETTFAISGINSGLITGLVMSLVVLVCVASALFFFLKKKSPKKTST